MSEQLSVEQRVSIQASFERQGFLHVLGALIVRLEPGRCVIELPFGKGVSQQHGFFHGGAIGALADVAGGYAAMTMVDPGCDVLTLEYKINFLRPATGAMLTARGEVLRAGRTVIVTRVDVLDVEGRLCAAMQQSIAPAPIVA
jgi:uncharacterized protein (TIGR00369 family)